MKKIIIILLGITSLLDAAVLSFSDRSRIDFDADGTDELRIENSAIGSAVVGGTAYPVWNLRVSSSVELLRNIDGDLMQLTAGSLLHSGTDGFWTESPIFGFAEEAMASGFSGEWGGPYGNLQSFKFGFRIASGASSWRYGFATLDLYQNNLQVFGSDEVVPLPLPGLPSASFEGVYLENNSDMPITIIPEPSSGSVVGIGLLLLALRRTRKMDKIGAE